jgi:hypothetical protein
MTTLDHTQVNALRDLLGVYLRQYAPQWGAALANGGVAETDAATVRSDIASPDLTSPHSEGAEGDTVAAISGAIVTWQARAQAIHAQGLELEAWVQAVLADFDPQAALAQVVDAAVEQSQQIVTTRIHQWRQSLRSQVWETLSAYVQTYVPDLGVEALRPTVMTILPMVADGQLTRAETEAIVAQIKAQFDPAALLDRVIDPTWRAVATQVATYLENTASLESALKDTVNAYVQTHSPALVEMGEGLIERLLAQVLKKRSEFNIDVAVDPELERLVIRQVSFKLHWLEASPPPSKTALEIAQQVTDEVTGFTHRREQPSTMPEVYHHDDVTSDTSRLGGPLEVGIVMQPDSDQGTETAPGEAVNSDAHPPH